MSAEAAQPSVGEKAFAKPNYVEDVANAHGGLVYDQDDEEPELHLRTYIALAAMFLLNLVQVFALLAPPAVVR